MSAIRETNYMSNYSSSWLRLCLSLSANINAQTRADPDLLTKFPKSRPSTIHGASAPLRRCREKPDDDYACAAPWTPSCFPLRFGSIRSNAELSACMTWTAISPGYERSARCELMKNKQRSSANAAIHFRLGAESTQHRDYVANACLGRDCRPAFRWVAFDDR